MDTSFLSTSGTETIRLAFEKALVSKSAALMPYYTLGYPNREVSLDVIEAIAPHCDLIELGVAFSDPLADGPTIQHSTQVALENGITLSECLEMTSELRKRGVQNPFLLFGYYNPFLAYGLERLVSDADSAGIQGFIVPDLPPEEASDLVEAAVAAGMAYVYFLAPTSNPKRIDNVVAHAQGFIYLVSLTGVTGARKALDPALAGFIARVRQGLDGRDSDKTHLAVGFGISTAEQTKKVSQIADGVIVGSALIDAVDNANDKPNAAAEYIRTLNQALMRPADN